MADNLKPYNPNKGPISIRLNPDALKEEALNLIPWPVGTIAREMYRNPNGSIVETAKQVGRETPILGSLLSGEYDDAAKEAILFGMPIKAKTKAKVKNLGPDTRFYSDPNYQYGKITDYANPVNGKNGFINQFADDLEFDKSPKNLNAQIGTPNFGMTEMLNSIDNSNAMHKLNGKNERISYRNDYDEAMNPYNNSRFQSDPNFINTPEGFILNEGEQLVSKLGDIQSKGTKIKVAEAIKPKLKPGESLIEDADGNIFILKGNDVYNLQFANDRRSTRFYKHYSNLSPQEIATEFTPYNPLKHEKAKKSLDNDIAVYNTYSDFYDTHVPIDPNKAARVWYDDLLNRRDAYNNSVNGPFIEDLLHRGR